MKTRKDANLVKSIIENRVNHWEGEYEKKTYHVDIEVVNGGRTGFALEVRPLNGDTFYCVDDLYEVSKCFGASVFISIDLDKKIYARIH